jgi:hypothetical protein
MKLAITFGLEHEKAHGASPGMGKTATLESGGIACLTRQASVRCGVQEGFWRTSLVANLPRLSIRASLKRASPSVTEPSGPGCPANIDVTV